MRMRRLNVLLLAALALALTAMPAVVLLWPRSTVPAAHSVSGGGFTLVSTEVALPGDDATFPSGAGSELLAANCTSCHSASMILNQPPLKPEQWQAMVKKMREVYKAPIAERDVSTLVDSLVALGARGSATRPPSPPA